jgi:hypothetical protein
MGDRRQPTAKRRYWRSRYSLHSAVWGIRARPRGALNALLVQVLGGTEKNINCFSLASSTYTSRA